MDTGGSSAKAQSLPLLDQTVASHLGKVAEGE